MFHKIVTILPGFKLVTLYSSFLLLINCYYQSNSESLLQLIYKLCTVLYDSFFISFLMILSKGVGISREFVDREEFNVIAIFTFVFYIVDMTY